MTTQSVSIGPERRFTRPEVILGVLAFLSFALIPVQINTIYDGLPAHPLFLHVPVILIPVAMIGGLVLAFRSRLFERHGIWLGAVTVVALGATNLTMAAGNALRADLGLEGGAAGFGGASSSASLIAQHAHAASIMRLLLIAFTAVFLTAVLAHRVAAGRKTGWHSGLDGLMSNSSVLMALRGVVALLAIACAFFVFRVGDLGAKAVWLGRLNAGGHGRPGAVFPGGGRGPFGPGAPPAP